MSKSTAPHWSKNHHYQTVLKPLEERLRTEAHCSDMDEVCYAGRIISVLAPYVDLPPGELAELLHDLWSFRAAEANRQRFALSRNKDKKSRNAKLLTVDDPLARSDTPCCDDRCPECDLGP